MSFSAAMEAACTSKIPAIPKKRKMKVAFTAIFVPTPSSTPHSDQIDAQLFKGLFAQRLIKESIILIIMNVIFYYLYRLIR